MAEFRQLLANSLARLERLHRAGQYVFASSDLSDTDRKRLINAGYLTPVIRGWYLTSRPGEVAGDTTFWYAAWKEFVARYANHRFDSQWHLAPDASLLMQTSLPLASRQVLLHTAKGQNNVIPLPHKWTVVDYRPPKLAPAAEVVEQDGLRLLSVPYALTQVSETFFRSQKASAEIALGLVRDPSDLAHALLTDSKPVVAGRLVGALRAVGREQHADQLLQTLAAAGARIVESNPFATPPTMINPAIKRSPYAMRLHLMWAAMRGQAMEALDEAPGVSRNLQDYLADIDARYVRDAYHSLSIEGYDVSPELIERVRSGKWSPNGEDKKSRDAMAAKGYSLAHAKVRMSIESIIRGENAGKTLRNDLPEWNRALWSPSVQAGILKPVELAGYRNGQVYIRNADHVPPPREAVRDCMPEFFDLIETESHPAARAVLGHFVFVFIHPYMDGNGRHGRFIMNAMLASGGYPWTIIPVEKRSEYLRALDEASARQNIGPFAEFIGGLVRAQAKAAHDPATKGTRLQ